MHSTLLYHFGQENIIVRKQTPSIQAEDKTKLLNEKLEKAKKQKKSIIEIKNQIEIKKKETRTENKKKMDYNDDDEDNKIAFYVRAN